MSRCGSSPFAELQRPAWASDFELDRRELHRTVPTCPAECRSARIAGTSRDRVGKRRRPIPSRLVSDKNPGASFSTGPRPSVAVSRCLGPACAISSGRQAYPSVEERNAVGWSASGDSPTTAAWRTPASLPTWCRKASTKGGGLQHVVDEVEVRPAQGQTAAQRPAGRQQAGRPHLCRLDVHRHDVSVLDLAPSGESERKQSQTFRR